MLDEYRLYSLGYLCPRPMWLLLDLYKGRSSSALIFSCERAID
ncbi:hypothetical protein [Microcoleus sp.]